MDIHRLGLIQTLFLILRENEIGAPNYTLAKYFLEHYTELGSLNIYDIAADCYVSRSSVRRFCKQIGYDNFKDLKEEFKKFDYQYNYFMHIARSNDYRSWLDSQLHEMVLELAQSMPSDELEQIAERIHDSKRVVFLSSYSSLMCIMEFQRPLVLSGKFVEIMSEPNMNTNYLKTLEPDDYIITVSASGNFAAAMTDVLSHVSAYKTLITASRKESLESPYNKVYHLSTKDYSNVKSVYGKYGLDYIFDLLYSAYIRKYGTKI